MEQAPLKQSDRYVPCSPSSLALLQRQTNETSLLLPLLLSLQVDDGVPGSSCSFRFPPNLALPLSICEFLEMSVCFYTRADRLLQLLRRLFVFSLSCSYLVICRSAFYPFLFSIAALARLFAISHHSSCFQIVCCRPLSLSLSVNLSCSFFVCLLFVPYPIPGIERIFRPPNADTHSHTHTHKRCRHSLPNSPHLSLFFAHLTLLCLLSLSVLPASPLPVTLIMIALVFATAGPIATLLRLLFKLSFINLFRRYNDV
jgi:hypothetical protein